MLANTCEPMTVRFSFLFEFPFMKFKYQFNVLQELDHPCIMKVFEFLSDKSHCKAYIIMELIPGKSLKSLIHYYKKIHKLIPESLIKSITIQLLSTLFYLHKKANVLHRDIKPSNIMISEGKHDLKIIDFGLAKKFVSKQEINNLDFTIFEFMTPTGTPYYKAPELVKGGILTEKIDIWSVGIVLFEMMRLKRIELEKINEKPESVIHLYSNDLFDLLTKMLRNSPMERYSATQSLSHSFFIKKNSEEILSPSISNSIYLERSALRTKTIWLKKAITLFEADDKRRSYSADFYEGSTKEIYSPEEKVKDFI